MAAVNQNCPDSLLDMCIGYCMNNLETLTNGNTFLDESHKERPSIFQDVQFPATIGDKMFQYAMNNVSLDWQQYMEDMLYLFSNPKHTPLTNVSIRREVNLSDRVWHKMFSHPISNLEIECCNICDVLSNQVFNQIQRLTSLRVLKLDTTRRCSKCHHDTKVHEKVAEVAKSIKFELNQPSLQALSVISFSSEKILLPTLIQPLSRLKSLNLTGCNFADTDMECFQWLPKQLTYLNLSAVVFNDLTESFNNISSLTQLRHLDVSISFISNQPKFYDSPVEKMAILLRHLKCLKSLDISGTNLAGMKRMEKESHRLEPLTKTDMTSRPLIVSSFGGQTFDFLGLWNCPDLPFSWEQVPAKQWTSWETDDQLLYSLAVYMENSPLLVGVLDKMFTRLREDQSLSHGKFAVPNLIRALQMYPAISAIRKSASACLFLTINRKTSELNQSIRTKIVQTLISCINHIENDRYTSKCCVCSFLCLDLPHDAIYCHLYERYVNCLLKVLQSYKGDFFENYALRLLHESCRVDKAEKDIVGGKLDTINFLLSMIHEKFTNGICDDAMERAWSCIWSLTDDMPGNAVRFMLHTKDSMKIYMSCFEGFPENAGLMKKMTGVMANLSEVKELRKEMMTENLMKMYSSLLDSKLDGEGVSYHAASVLSAMIADGPEAWTIEEPSRADVLAGLVNAINSWDLSNKKKIKYRSLNPIINLAAAFHAPEAQLWAVWALCNLTTTKADRYCDMLRREGGLSVLSSILTDEFNPLPRTVELASLIISQCEEIFSKKPDEDMQL